MASMAEFSKKVKRRMEEKDYSASELSRRAELDRSTVSRILAGKHSSISIETLQKIARALDVSPAKLVF